MPFKATGLLVLGVSSCLKKVGHLAFQEVVDPQSQVVDPQSEGNTITSAPKSQATRNGENVNDPPPLNRASSRNSRP